MSEAPALTADGVLRLKGWFPQERYNIKFDMTFRFEYEKWRILSIGIELEALDNAGAPAKPGDGQAQAAPAKAKQQ